MDLLVNLVWDFIRLFLLQRRYTISEGFFFWIFNACKTFPLKLNIGLNLQLENVTLACCRFISLQVVVSTKSPKADKQYVWEAMADSSSYVIKEETDPEKMLTRGTQITLFLRVSSLY